jgi:hypothetical protein
MNVVWMTSKKTIAEKNLTTIQLAKPTVLRLRQAEAYPRETYDSIIARIVQSQTAIAAKLKTLEAYPNEPWEDIVTGLVEEHNRIVRHPEQEPLKPSEPNKARTEPSAAETFQKELAKLTTPK